MELRQLRYLLAVADAGSFTAGARQAFVTQPTLSAAIAALEAELGVLLFERTPRGAALTDAGREAVGHARQALAAAAAITERSAPTVRMRALRVGVAPSLPPAVVADLLADLRRARPDRRLRVESASTSSIRRRLAAGRLDVAITVLADQAPAGLHEIEVAADALCLVYEASSRPARPVTPDLLQGAPLVVRTHCEYLSAAARVLDAHQVRPTVTARVDSDALALDLVAAGFGPCLMPDSLADRRTVAVAVDGLDLRRRIGLSWAGGGFDDVAEQLTHTWGRRR